MAQQEIDVGSIAGDGTGDPLRDAFTKINENFTELYSGNVQVTGANVLVYSVAGRTGNVSLTVNDVAQAASKSYVDSAISANISTVNSATNSLNANITAANSVISNHSSRLTTLESNAATQSTAITNLSNIKANISYVDTSIDLALSSNAILANVAAVNANVAAANAAILLRANLTGASFTGNISANSVSASNYIRTNTYFVGGTEANQGLGQAWANPAALFFANSAQTPGPGGSRYYQINLQNLDPLGSGDFVITADDGSDESNYINVGINGSQFYDPLFPEGYAHDGYVLVKGGDLDLVSTTGNVKIQAGIIPSAQIILTTGNVIQLGQNVKVRFPDGTLQTTAFGGNVNTGDLNANITAANVQISNLQANAAVQALDINALYSNAATQQVSINSLVTNAATQATSLNQIDANIGSYQIYANANASSQATSINSINANIVAANLQIVSLSSNAATQSLELDNLQSNTQAQQSNIILLQSNSASQATQIDLLNANVTAANTNITSLTSNAVTQATQINLLNANVTAANVNITTLQSNATSQALDIDNLYANINLYLSNVASSNANITAANARIIVIDANLGSTTSNVNTLQSNAATQAIQINLLNANIAAANIAKANLSGAVFSGNVQADYLLANANVKIAGSLEVGDASPVNYPDQAGVFVGNTNSYYQLVIQNINSGSNASGDLVITADDGTDTDGYINIGINSSGFQGNFTVPAGDTNIEEYSHDGYFEVIGGNAVLRTDSNVFIAANTKIVGLIQDNNFALINTDLQFKDGSVMSTANIGAQSYTPNSAANYNQTITNIQQALDELAARLKALGG